MQDLRESGNLEQDAHQVLMLYRPKTKEGEWSGEDEVLVEKCREGMCGRVEVVYDERTLTFRPRGVPVAQPVPISNGVNFNKMLRN